MIDKKAGLETGSVHAMHVDLSKDERLANLNISDSVLCVTVLQGNITEGPLHIIYEDVCMAGRGIIPLQFYKVMTPCH